MSLAIKLTDLTTRIAAEIKSLRILINGNASDLSALTTSQKANLVGAINEVAAEIDNIQSGGIATDLESLTDVDLTSPTTGHLLRHDGSQFVNVLGTTHFDAAGAAAAAQAAAIAASQPSDPDLTAIASLTTTPYGRGILALANQAALAALLPNASETVLGLAELATQAETDTGTADNVVLTPLKLQTRLTAFAQPYDSDLVAIANLSTTAYGRAFLTLADQAALMTLVRVASEAAAGVVELATNAETTTGTDSTRAVHPAGLAAAIAGKANTASLAAVATSGLASDLTGVLNTAQLPALAINDTFTAANQAAMLALNAQRGDLAIRTDTGKMFILTADAPTVLGNWVQLTATGDVASVNGRVGTVVLAKNDVGLDQVDNTSDANKPVSTATATALSNRQPLDGTLTALAGLTTAANQLILATGPDTFSMLTTGAMGRTVLDAATAADVRNAISVYSQAEIGNPETDFVATFNAGLV